MKAFLAVLVAMAAGVAVADPQQAQVQCHGTVHALNGTWQSELFLFVSPADRNHGILLSSGFGRQVLSLEGQVDIRYASGQSRGTLDIVSTAMAEGTRQLDITFDYAKKCLDTKHHNQWRYAGHVVYGGRNWMQGTMDAKCWENVSTSFPNPSSTCKD